MKVGAIAYNLTKNSLKVCLVRSKNQIHSLNLPEGIANLNEDSARAALRVLYEQTGLHGKVIYTSNLFLRTFINYEMENLVYIMIEVNTEKDHLSEYDQNKHYFLTFEEALNKRLNKNSRKVIMELAKFKGVLNDHDFPSWITEPPFA